MMNFDYCQSDGYSDLQSNSFPEESSSRRYCLRPMSLMIVQQSISPLQVLLFVAALLLLSQVHAILVPAQRMAHNLRDQVLIASRQAGGARRDRSVTLSLSEDAPLGTTHLSIYLFSSRMSTMMNLISHESNGVMRSMIVNDSLS